VIQPRLQLHIFSIVEMWRGETFANCTHYRNGEWDNYQHFCLDGQSIRRMKALRTSHRTTFSESCAECDMQCRHILTDQVGDSHSCHAALEPFIARGVSVMLIALCFYTQKQKSADISDCSHWMVCCYDWYWSALGCLCSYWNCLKGVNWVVVLEYGRPPGPEVNG